VKESLFLNVLEAILDLTDVAKGFFTGRKKFRHLTGILFFSLLTDKSEISEISAKCCQYYFPNSSTGLKLQALDPAQVAIIALLFPAEDFQHYHCDEYLSMGIPIDDMVKAIRCADKDDTITI
jgi:hypothetical protein